MRITSNFNSRVIIWWQITLFILMVFANSTLASTANLAKGSYSYVGGKSKDIASPVFSSPSLPAVSPLHHQSSPPNSMPASASTSSHAATSYYEPRGDYGGGGGGGCGWGGGAGSGGGAGHSVYQYTLQPQPYYHPAPMYYDDGGYDGSEKGLIGLLGLSGFKGLLGLLGLAKLLLPLLGLLLPLLLPLLLLKALALLALILLIPVPVITTGGALAPAIGRKVKVPTSFEEGKTYLKDVVTDLIGKIPTDMNQIISKIKDVSLPVEEVKEVKEDELKSTKQKKDKSTSRSRSKSK